MRDFLRRYLWNSPATKWSFIILVTPVFVFCVVDFIGQVFFEWQLSQMNGSSAKTMIYFHPIEGLISWVVAPAIVAVIYHWSTRHRSPTVLVADQRKQFGALLLFSAILEAVLILVRVLFSGPVTPLSILMAFMGLFIIIGMRMAMTLSCFLLTHCILWLGHFIAQQ